MDAETIHRRRWWTLLVLCLSLMVITLDNTILNVALPTLVKDLGATNSQLQWIVDGYTLVFAGLLLTAGTKGRRFILPHAKVMIHQPYGGITGQAEDIRLQAEQIIKSKQLLTDIIAKHTGQSAAQVKEDSERDKYFDAQEAKAYGLVDEVLTEPPEELKMASGGNS